MMEIPNSGYDRGVVYSLESTTTRAPDGEYRVVDEFLCQCYPLEGRRGEDEPKPECRFIYSKTKVKVSNGIIDTGALLKAGEELKNKSHYGGVFLEHFQWCNSPGPSKGMCNATKWRRIHPMKEDGTYDVEGPIPDSCGRDKIADMSEEEKQMWADGVFYLWWGS
jgi:hypothetical protein